MSKRSRSLAALFACAFIAGCSGGQNPIPSRGTANGRHSTFTLRIHIPKRNPHHALGSARPNYVSPATQGMTVAISGPQSLNATVGLTPTSTGCSSGLTGTTCQLTIALAPCAVTNCYLATIATYDDVSCTRSSCSIPPGAHELSAAQSVPFTIVTGQNNVANLTLGGIPATIAVTPVHPGYINGDARRLQLWGAAPQKVAAIALDADGNAIVGPGAPAISASSSSATLNVTPDKAPSSTFVLEAATRGSPPAVTPGSVDLSITATPPSDSGGSPLPITVPVAIAHSAVYVALSSNAINVYYDGNTSMTPNLQIAGASTNIDDINQLAVDGNGTLYVTQGVPLDGTVLEFPAGTHGNVAPSVTIAGAATTLSTAYGIAVGPNGAFYVSSFAETVTEFAQGASGNATPIATIGTGSLFAPECIALDSAGTLYVADDDVGGVLEFPAGSSGSAPPATTISGTNPNFDQPLCLAVDGSGALYVSDMTPQIAKFALGATGNAVPVARITGSLTNLTGPVFALAVDAAGTIYAGTSTTPGAIDEFSAGANGNVSPAATIPTTDGVFAVFAVPAPRLNVITP
ncbi:MAG: hypothetical protein JO302_00880 [Candidatus Eremiobacteraeota bacterium]|nr:hypothetical protein [Candidatus Eremiobacteraeota bacterium]